MIRVRSSEDRGRGRASWLESRHSFSFADYHDPDHMSFRALRVLNEDWIAPASGFGTHPHRDMEILTYPVAGELEHRDSQGGYSRLTPGRIQLMTAGTGIVHSEVNTSANETLHLLQIWLLPDRAGHAPGYQVRDIDFGAAPLHPLVTPDGRDGTLRIQQDALIHRLDLPAGVGLEHALAPGRHAWLQLIRGDATLNDTALAAGDGAAVSGESDLRVIATCDTEALLFDLA
jgi:redox-sensitive bicupin YhaK (pirin superfamily)